MGNVLLDALIDSLKLFAVVLVCTYIIALIEPKLSEKIRLKGKLAPLIGASVSLLPQCGFSVVATDLYQKRHITVGTLIGVYLTTSDEALPIFLSYPDKALHILPLLAIKFALGLIFGYLFDFLFYKNRQQVEHHLSHCNEEYHIKLMHAQSAELVEDNKVCKNVDCDCSACKESACAHHHTAPKVEHSEGILYDYYKKCEDRDKKRKKIDRFLIKPFSHSMEIFLYVLVVNIIFGIIFYFVGEEKIISFLTANKYIAPLIAVFIGAIPNCVSSIVLSELYIFGGLGFGATLGGLLMNTGVAFTLLLKIRSI